jgi:hypothetical protein
MLYPMSENMRQNDLFLPHVALPQPSNTLVVPRCTEDEIGTLGAGVLGLGPLQREGCTESDAPDQEQVSPITMREYRDEAAHGINPSLMRAPRVCLRTSPRSCRWYV